MFGFGKKIMMNVQHAGLLSPDGLDASVLGLGGSASNLGLIGPDVSGFHVHTIPSKFLPKAVVEGSSRTKRVMVWIVGALIVSGLLLFASSLLVKSVRKNEVARVQNTVVIPPIQNVNIEPPLESRLVERDLGACTFSRASAGYDQQLTVGDIPVTGYTASYFCDSGSLSVQVLKFQNETSLSQRIQGLESRYRAFRDRLVQDVADEQKILWGSGIYLVQVTANSLLLDNTNVSVLLDEYLRLYPPSPNLPWNFAPVVTLASAAERDAKRVSDIKKIQIALEFYKIDKGAYPAVLDQTVDPDLKNYVQEIPVNPEPGGSSYAYIQKSGGQSYEMGFTLEAGSGGIPAGEIIARPQGMFPKNRELSSLLPSSSDRDADGLTDVEEDVWGTDPSLFDSDQDTYADGKEVRDGYDPGVAGDARIELSVLVKSYLSSANHVSTLYPKSWTLEDQDNRQTAFFSQDKKDFFQILSEDAGTISSMIDWYRGEFPTEVEEDPKLMTLSGAEGSVASPDGLTVYALFSGKLYTISYNPGIKDTLDYQTTFQLFLKSFKFFENPS